MRSLLRTPVFTASAILTLALGVGANTGAFTALHQLLLKPLPYPQPNRLVSLYETTVDRKPRTVAEANLLDFRAHTASFDGMAVYQPRTFGLTRGAGDAVTVIQTGMVMADFFRVLAVPPALGRTFTEQEEIAEAPLLVLSDRAWRNLFSADLAIVGRRVELNEEAFDIIGVMPPGFEFPMGTARPDAYRPLSRKDYCCGRLGSQEAIARIRPGVAIERARSELEAAGADLARLYPATNRGRSAGLRPLDEVLTGSRREPLFLLLAAASLLLLIACANVAGLMLARYFARRHEMAIRAALGAGLVRLARQCFAEAAVISIGGAVCGLGMALAVLRLVPRFVPGAALDGPLPLDPTAFGFALALSILVTLLLGAAPAVLLRRADLNLLMKSGGRQAGGARDRLRGALVVTQVALSVVLLLSTGVLLRSFLRLLDTSPGFVTAHAFRFGIGLPEKRYDTELKLIVFHRDLLSKMAAIPGVERVGAAQRFPLRGGPAGAGGTFQIAGSNIPAPQRPRSWTNTVTPGYFDAMGIPILEGRDFSWQDDRPAQHRVAIVNQTFARAYLRGRRPLGTQLDVRFVTDLNPPGVLWEIVGVAGDTRQASLDHEPLPEIYLSLTQIGAEGASYVIRAHADDPALPQAIARAVTEQDPRIQRVTVEPLRAIVDRNLGSRDAAIRLTGGFGFLALLLTAVGVYGIVAFRAAERSREMAIRSALGATPTELRSLVWGHAARIALGGTALGLAGFAAAAPLLKSQLYQISPGDPLSLAIVAAVVFAIALAAAVAPSRRAGRTAPMELLRDA